MRHCLALLAGLALLVSTASAQSPASSAQAWTAYPAFNDVRAVASSDDAIWAASPAGVFSYEPNEGSFTRYTTVDGLTGGDVGALAVDPDGRVWVGYTDGTLDRITPDTGEVRSFLDIERADQYASRGINRIRPREGVLIISTDFGLVLFDTAANLVRQTAARLGPLPAATPVRDAILAPGPDGADAYWLATDGGILRAPLSTANLSAPTAWAREAAFDGPAYSLAFFQGDLWVGGEPDGGFGDIYRQREDGEFERRGFMNNEVTHLVATSDALFGMLQADSRTFAIRPGQGNRFYQTFPNAPRLSAIALGPNGQLWAGDAGLGLFAYPTLPPDGSGEVALTPVPVLPEGPLTNEVVSIDIATDQTVWTASGSVPFGIGNTSGVSWLTVDGEWRTVRADDPSSVLPNRSLKRAVARPEGGALIGTSGGGLTVVEEDGATTTFDESNSTLRSAGGSSDFVVVSDALLEDDRWWVLNQSSPIPLHFFPGISSASPTDWVGLPPPPGAPSSVGGVQMTLDSFGQKWIALGSGGLMVWDTGSDPASPADDRARVFSVGINGQGLPNGEANAVARDREGRIWIGTRRGIAVVFSPGSAFGGDPGLAEPQWPRVSEESSEQPSYLLRDVEVRDMAFDPAGRLWIATSTGAYLLNPEGDEVSLRLEAASTPLPTDDLVSVAVDSRSGEVYFATASGMYSYAGDATSATLASESLQLAPNPFRPSQHADIRISGLNAPASRVRVLTVDGRVVYESAATFGGSFRWDGRDARTGERVPSGVYLVAASGANGEQTIYGRLAVIH